MNRINQIDARADVRFKKESRDARITQYRRLLIRVSESARGRLSKSTMKKNIVVRLACYLHRSERANLPRGASVRARTKDFASPATEHFSSLSYHAISFCLCRRYESFTLFRGRLVGGQVGTLHLAFTFVITSAVHNRRSVSLCHSMERVQLVDTKIKKKKKRNKTNLKKLKVKDVRFNVNRGSEFACLRLIRYHNSMLRIIRTR